MDKPTPGMKQRFRPVLIYETEIMSKTIQERLFSNDGVDRRGFLQCMAWAGTGMAWAMKGGVANSQETHQGGMHHDGFQFVQISDSHIGFSKASQQGRDRDAPRSGRAHQCASNDGPRSFCSHRGH